MMTVRQSEEQEEKSTEGRRILGDGGSTTRETGEREGASTISLMVDASVPDIGGAGSRLQQLDPINLLPFMPNCVTNRCEILAARQPE